MGAEAALEPICVWWMNVDRKNGSRGAPTRLLELLLEVGELFAQGFEFAAKGVEFDFESGYAIRVGGAARNRRRR